VCVRARAYMKTHTHTHINTNTLTHTILICRMWPWSTHKRQQYVLLYWQKKLSASNSHHCYIFVMTLSPCSMLRFEETPFFSAGHDIPWLLWYLREELLIQTYP